MEYSKMNVVSLATSICEFTVKLVDKPGLCRTIPELSHIEDVYRVALGTRAVSHLDR